VTGRTVDINSNVNGDIFCAGQNVTISGAVKGDVICAAQTLTISGNVSGDVRLAGQTVTLSSAVAGNATVASQSFVEQSGGTVDGDMTIGATDTTLNGKVGRDLAIGGNSAIIASQVSRNVEARVNQLHLASSAQVGGNVHLISHNNLTKDSGAAVGGKVSRSEPPQKQSSAKHTWLGFSLAWFVYWLLAMLAFALVIALVFPQLLVRVTSRAIPRPWKAMLIGFLAGLAAQVVIIVCAITIIGIPVAVFLGLLWALILILSGPTFAYYLGRLIMRDSKHILLTMLVGALVLILLYFIPFVNLLAIAVAIWTGSGLLLLELFERRQKPVYIDNSVPVKKR
jgi:cytoskeletal protein CcmA (bactofilin family)